MQETSTQGSEHIFRVDKFMVPNAARDEFLARVISTHRVLRQQPGFVRDNLLEQIARPGVFNIVTIVEWATQTNMETAKLAVAAVHEQTGFKSQEVLARLGIQADIANYRELTINAET